MMNNYECMNCEWYNKPYWSIISPCANCTKRFKQKSATVHHYSIIYNNKELYKEIEDLKKENKRLKELLGDVDDE